MGLVLTISGINSETKNKIVQLGNQRNFQSEYPSDSQYVTSVFGNGPDSVKRITEFVNLIQADIYPGVVYTITQAEDQI